MMSVGNGQRNQLLGRAVGTVEPAAGVDQLSELRLADGEAGGDRANAAGFLLEIPDEFAAGAFPGEAPAVLREDGDPRAEQGAVYRWDQGDAMHQVQHPRRVSFAGAGLPAPWQRVAAFDGTPGGEILRAADLRRAVD